MPSNPSDLPTIDAAESALRQPDFQPFILSNLVDGSLSLDTTADYCDSFNPKTGQLVAKVYNASPGVVDQAVDAADRAFPSWSTTPPSKRSEHLLQIAALIEQRKELFAVWESIDQGKTLVRARAEVDRAVSNFRYSLDLMHAFSLEGVF
jgi:acyl-CoA reductase-like NAD-dependent aldehyde dehydrogenase